MQTARSTYLRSLWSYFTTWKEKSWFCLTANFKMNLWRVCTAQQISLQDILYPCHKPCREDRDGCFLYWADGLMVIILPFSVLTFFSCHTPVEDGSHLLWITRCSESNVAAETCSRESTRIRKWWQQTHHGRRQKQRHPSELNIFDAYEHVTIQEKSQRAYIQAKTHASKTNKENQCFDIWHS